VFWRSEARDDEPVKLESTIEHHPGDQEVCLSILKKCACIHDELCVRTCAGEENAKISIAETQDCANAKHAEIKDAPEL